MRRRPFSFVDMHFDFSHFRILLVFNSYFISTFVICFSKQSTLEASFFVDFKLETLNFVLTPRTKILAFVHEFQNERTSIMINY